MKNFEKFEKEIMEIIKSGHTFAVVNGKPVNCMTATCNSCELQTNACFKDRYRWMFSEYKERPKLTKQERKFCELFGCKDVWFARDRTGDLFMYVSEFPYRSNDGECWYTEGSMMGMDIFDAVLFSFIEWEDEEPWHISELLKLEVKE